MAKHITHNNKDVQQNAHRPALPNTYQQTVNKKTHKIGSTKLSQFAAAGIFQQQQQTTLTFLAAVDPIFFCASALLPSNG